MGSAVWLIRQLVKELIYGNAVEQVAGLLILVFSGFAVYIFATFLTKTVKKEELKALFSKR